MPTLTIVGQPLDRAAFLHELSAFADLPYRDMTEYRGDALILQQASPRAPYAFIFAQLTGHSPAIELMLHSKPERLTATWRWAAYGGRRWRLQARDTAAILDGWDACDYCGMGDHDSTMCARKARDC